MSAKDLYNELTTSIGYELVEKGFEAKGTTFYRAHDDNFGLISFQKSPKSTPTEILFTIEIGVFSGLISAFCAPDKVINFPALPDAHWRKNIGDLLPAKEEQWWSIRNTQIQSLKSELTEYLSKLALPELDKHIDTKSLGAAWFKGNHPGITDFQRLLYLSIVLKSINRPNELMDVLSEMETKYTGSPEQGAMEAHLNQIL